MPKNKKKIKLIKATVICDEEVIYYFLKDYELTQTDTPFNPKIHEWETLTKVVRGRIEKTYKLKGTDEGGNCDEEEEDDPAGWTLEKAAEKETTRTGEFVEIKELKVGDVFSAYTCKHSMVKRIYTVNKVTDSNVMTTKCRYDEYEYRDAGGDFYTYHKFVSKEEPYPVVDNVYPQKENIHKRRFKRNPKYKTSVLKHIEGQPIFIRVYKTDMNR